MIQIEIAKLAGEFLHNNQKYGDDDYSKHLEDVYNILCEFKIVDMDILTASWLHDSIEDTQATYKIISKYFGERVADIVYCVTDESGKNRKERKEKTYPKLKKNPKAVTLKIADRLANVRNSKITLNNKMFSMYKKEHSEFFAYLSNGENLEMWKELNNLFNF